MSASRQPHCELGEVTEFAIDRDGAAVLLRYDLVADRQPKPGAFAGRLGCEERLEQLLPVLRRNANAIVAHPDLDAFAELRLTPSRFGWLVACCRAPSHRLPQGSSGSERSNYNRDSGP